MEKKKIVILVIAAIVSLIAAGIVTSAVNWILAIVRVPSLPWFIFWGLWIVGFWKLLPLVKKEIEKF
jgi:hypothetical protein